MFLLVSTLWSPEPKKEVQFLTRKHEEETQRNSSWVTRMERIVGSSLRSLEMWRFSFCIHACMGCGSQESILFLNWMLEKQFFELFREHIQSSVLKYKATNLQFHFCCPVNGNLGSSGDIARLPASQHIHFPVLLTICSIYFPMFQKK